MALETGLKPAELRARADVVHAVGDLAAPISSGSFATLGMIVAPCSVRTMAEIATGATTTLLSRAADVVLKERRRLVLLVRETPLHTGHLRHDDGLVRDGRDHRPAGAGLLRQAAQPRGDDRPDAGAAPSTCSASMPAVVRRWGEPEPAEPPRKRGKPAPC